MKNIIISLNERDITFSYPLAQLGDLMSQYMKIPLVTEANWAGFKEPFDTVYLLAGSFGYCNFRLFVEEAMWTCKKFVFIQNDYRYPLANQLKNILKLKPEIEVEWWATSPEYQPCRGNAFFKVKPKFFDMNKIVWNPIAFADRFYREGLLYYGNARPDRVDTLMKYLETGLYPVSISATRRDLWRWYYLFKNKVPARFVTAFESLEEIQKYQMALFAVDDISQHQYETPSTKFYECLSAGIPMLFDVKCNYTFKTAGFDISKWIISQPEDVVSRLHDWDTIRKEQRNLLSRDFMKEFIIQFKETVCLKTSSQK